jgi:3-oxoacyl-[acyl-carrier protein] reductase
MIANGASEERARAGSPRAGSPRAGSPGAGRVVLVAGAGGGVGLAVAEQFAAAGYHVLVNGRNPGRAAEIVTRLSGVRPGARFTPYPGDVGDRGSVESMFERIAAEVGHLDALVDCSELGLTTPSGEPVVLRGRFAELDPARFEQAILNALLPSYLLCFYALPLLRAAGGGAIVTYGTDAGKVALPGQSITGPTRAALNMFTRTLAMELSGDQIRVNCVSPTFIRDTPIFDREIARGAESRAGAAAKRAKLGLPSPRELAELTLFLCSDSAAQLTGQVISVNGGLSAAG